MLETMHWMTDKCMWSTIEMMAHAGVSIKTCAMQ